MLDNETGLYYFNARWYDPKIGRFVSEDPAKDGNNWYAYCSNNPINYIDPTGNYITPNSTSYLMQGKGWKNQMLGNADSTFNMGLYGCYATALTNGINTLTGKNLTPGDFNSIKTFFYSKGNDDTKSNIISISKIATYFGLESVTYTKNFAEAINQMLASENHYAIIAAVKYKEDSKYYHAVNIVGKKTINGKTYYKIAGSSASDSKANRRPEGWIINDEGTFVPEEYINTLYGLYDYTWKFQPEGKDFYWEFSRESIKKNPGYYDKKSGYIYSNKETYDYLKFMEEQMGWYLCNNDSTGGAASGANPDSGITFDGLGPNLSPDSGIALCSTSSGIGSSDSGITTLYGGNK